MEQLKMKMGTLIWNTSQRTQGPFLCAVKRKLYFDIYNLKNDKRHKLIKAISFLGLVTSKRCKGIIIDGGVKIPIVIFCRLFHVPIYMRLRGGMCGEKYDYRAISNKKLLYLDAAWKKFVLHFCLKNSEKIFAVSIFCKSQVLYELPEIEIKRIEVLYKPVEFEKINTIKKGVFRKKFNLSGEILLTTTNFNYKRKYEALIEYHDAIIAQLEFNPNWSYVITGGGADVEQFRRLIFKITPTAMQHRVFVIGHYHCIYEAMVDADLFLQMSFRDTASQVVKEAQATGLPVIGNYSCFGSNEFIQNNPGKNLLFETCSELSFMLSELMAKPMLRKKLGDYNRGYAQRHYLPESSAQKFVSALGK